MAANIDDVVDHYYQKVYKLALYYLGNSADAEDATQQTFVKVLEKLASFRGEADLFTWVYRIACNISISILRRRNIIAFITLDSAKIGTGSGYLTEGYGHSAEPHSDPAQTLEAEQEELLHLKQFQIALNRLSTRERTAFYLYHYEEIKQREIAVIMQTSLSAVEALLHKALKKLRRHLNLEKNPTPPKSNIK